MIIKINGKDHEFKPGIRFVNEVDKTFAGANAQYGAGMVYLLPRLLDFNVPSLAKMLYLGTCTEKNRPKEDDVNTYVEEVEDIEALFQEALETLKNANATKLQVKKLLELYENLKQPDQKAKQPTDTAD